MPQRQPYTYKVPRRYYRGDVTTPSDVVILVIIALFLVSVGAGALGYYEYKKHKANSSSTNISTPVAATDQSKIPVTTSSQASAADGQYLGKTNVPILMYHYIRPLPPDSDKLGQNLSVTPQNFAKQMAYLQSAGYQNITFDDMRVGKIPTKPIIITFDDGYSDAYTNAYPILAKYGQKGVFYVITGFVGKDGYLTWQQILEMSQNGMILGSHSVSHLDLSSSSLSNSQILSQLTNSKKALESKLGITINDFCYPSGKATKTTINDVYDAGYKTATSTKENIVQSGAFWLWLPRLRIENSTNLSTLLVQFK